MCFLLPILVHQLSHGEPGHHGISVIAHLRLGVQFAMETSMHFERMLLTGCVSVQLVGPEIVDQLKKNLILECIIDTGRLLVYNLCYSVKSQCTVAAIKHFTASST